MHSAYKHIKSLCELSEKELGIVTQCIAHKTLLKKQSMMLAQNLCLKMNAKLGGTNWLVLSDPIRKWVLERHAAGRGTLFLGADTYHPSPASRQSRDQVDLRPSIAAVRCDRSAQLKSLLDQQ